MATLICSIFFNPVYGILIGIAFPGSLFVIAKALGASNKIIRVGAIPTIILSIGLMLLFIGVIGLPTEDSMFFKSIITVGGLTPQWTLIASGLIVIGLTLVSTLITGCVLRKISNRRQNIVQNLREFNDVTSSSSGPALLSQAAFSIQIPPSRLYQNRSAPAVVAGGPLPRPPAPPSRRASTEFFESPLERASAPTRSNSDSQLFLLT